ncbi:MAG: tetratricopeptide repeat protein [Thiotrichaceae bacterium]
MNQPLLRITCALYLSIACVSPHIALADNLTKTVDTAATQATASAQLLFEQASVLIKQNEVAAGIKLLQKAADQHHPKALLELASYYELGLGVTKDYSMAVEYYEKAIKAGSTDAYFNLALLMIKPEAAINNLKDARALMMILAKQGDVGAQYSLSLMFKDELNNTGVDYKQSISWLRLAASAGHADAEFNLGLHYLKGEQVAKSHSKAFRWFNKAANKGLPRAQFNLALMYEQGTGTSIDLNRSLKWYKSASLLGNANAQQNLGIKYLLGNEIEQNDSKAISLLTHAAKQRHKDAQFLLARLYHKGRKTIKADKLEAEKWYLLSAGQGHREAQYQLALILSKEVNRQDAAKYWAYQAAFAGHKSAYLLQAKL